MTVTKEHKSLIQRIGIDLSAILLFGILFVWNTGSFKTHVEDFEQSIVVDVAKLETRVVNLENRERDLISVISELSTNTARLYKDIIRLETRIDELLRKLNDE